MLENQIYKIGSKKSIRNYGMFRNGGLRIICSITGIM